jgi:hypothetical protein
MTKKKSSKKEKESEPNKDERKIRGQTKTKTTKNIGMSA